MSVVTLNVENNLRAAVLELLRTFTLLEGIVPQKNIIAWRDTSQVSSFPCVTVKAHAFVEHGIGTGWYMGELQLSAVSYRPEDPDQTHCLRLLGALRAFAQQDNLVALLNATNSAKSASAPLDVRHIDVSEAAAFDYSEEKVNEHILPVSVLCRPSRVITP